MLFSVRDTHNFLVNARQIFRKCPIKHRYKNEHIISSSCDSFFPSASLLVIQLKLNISGFHQYYSYLKGQLDWNQHCYWDDEAFFINYFDSLNIANNANATLSCYLPPRYGSVLLDLAYRIRIILLIIMVHSYLELYLVNDKTVIRSDISLAYYLCSGVCFLNLVDWILHSIW